MCVGCGTEPAGGGENVSSSQSAIQGGTVDKAHDYAVGVCGTDTTPGQCAIVCSGVLIAPNLVATARHCVDQVTSSTVDCTSDSFGALLAPADQFWITTNYMLVQPSLGWHQVKQIVTPQATGFCGNDLALLILSENVAATEASPATPEVQYPMTDPSIVSGSETAIGYGNTAPGASDYGTRHTKQNIPILCIPGDAEAPCAPVSQSRIATNEFNAGDGPCDGDSGSTAIEQNSFNLGTPLALGVLSRGGVQGALCSGSVYTRFDTWHDLIVGTAMTAASLGDYSVPTWTLPAPALDSGATEGGAVDASCPDSDACTAAQPSPAHGCSAAGGGTQPSWLGPGLLGLAIAAVRRRRRAAFAAGSATGCRTSDITRGAGSWGLEAVFCCTTRQTAVLIVGPRLARSLL